MHTNMNPYTNQIFNSQLNEAAGLVTKLRPPPPPRCTGNRDYQMWSFVCWSSPDATTADLGGAERRICTVHPETTYPIYVLALTA